MACQAAIAARTISSPRAQRAMPCSTRLPASIRNPSSASISVVASPVTSNRLDVLARASSTRPPAMREESNSVVSSPTDPPTQITPSERPRMPSWLPATGRNDGAIIAHGVGFDRQSTFSEDGLNPSGEWVRAVDPHDNSRILIQRPAQPTQRCPQRPDRPPSPVHQRNVVFASGDCRACRRYHAQIAASVQLEQEFSASRSSDDDTVSDRATRLRDQWLDDVFVVWL